MAKSKLYAVGKRAFHEAIAHLDRDGKLVACARAFSALTLGEQARGAVNSEDVAPDLDSIALRAEKKFLSQCLGSGQRKRRRG
jgi:hypothetical protein